MQCNLRTREVRMHWVSVVSGYPIVSIRAYMHMHQYTFMHAPCVRIAGAVAAETYVVIPSSHGHVPTRAASFSLSETRAASFSLNMIPCPVSDGYSTPRYSHDVRCSERATSHVRLTTGPLPPRSPMHAHPYVCTHMYFVCAVYVGGCKAHRHRCIHTYTYTYSNISTYMCVIYMHVVCMFISHTLRHTTSAPTDACSGRLVSK